MIILRDLNFVCWQQLRVFEPLITVTSPHLLMYPWLSLHRASSITNRRWVWYWFYLLVQLTGAPAKCADTQRSGCVSVTRKVSPEWPKKIRRIPSVQTFELPYDNDSIDVTSLSSTLRVTIVPIRSFKVITRSETILPGALTWEHI